MNRPRLTTGNATTTAPHTERRRERTRGSFVRKTTESQCRTITTETQRPANDNRTTCERQAASAGRGSATASNAISSRESAEADSTAASHGALGERDQSLSREYGVAR